MSRAAWDAVRLNSKAKGTSLALLDILAYYSHDLAPPFECRMTQQTLMRYLHVKKRALHVAIARLCDLRELERRREGRANVYTITLEMVAGDAIGAENRTYGETTGARNRTYPSEPDAIGAENRTYGETTGARNRTYVHPTNGVGKEQQVHFLAQIGAENRTYEDQRAQIISGLKARLKGDRREELQNGDSISSPGSQRENYHHSEEEKEEMPEETRRPHDLDVDTLWRRMKEEMTPWFTAAQVANLVNGAKLSYKDGQLIFKARSSDAARTLIRYYSGRMEDLVAYIVRIDEPPPLVIHGPLGAIS